MPATNQNLKDFFALSGNNPPVTNNQLLELQGALNQALNKVNTDANDVVDFCYQFLRGVVIAYKQNTTIVIWGP